MDDCNCPYGGFNRFFIAYLLAIFLNGHTKSWSSFIKDHIDHAVKDGNTLSIKDDILGLCKDILLCLLLNDKNVNTATGYVMENIKNVENSKNNDENKKKCKIMMSLTAGSTI
ncbi:hypothetical protein AJ78_05384 [Emergomyces pasteurianus Ep9510]|uniref:Uncharacterized protein n=1 Tax=Emergomyces pasteurianus Ep9510 TaxID=1447872 RepID=A0A1J9QDN6_9EURO|nr:hypothetical protein AJ78_05384 [Emergomyces pasteurianus Ep9510]